MKRIFLSFICSVLFAVSGVLPGLNGILEAPSYSLLSATPHEEKTAATTEPINSLPAAPAITTPEEKPRKETKLTPCRPANFELQKASASTASPGFHESAQEVFYNINGTTVEDLRAQITACGPLLGGRRFAASTKRSVAWAYKVEPSNGLCSLSNISVSVSQMFIYPAWNSQGANSIVTRSWQSFLGNLKKHEQGHDRINKEQASRLYTTLTTVRNVDCSNITSDVSQKSPEL